MAAALTVEAVSKRFRVYRNRSATLRESMIRLLSGRRERARELWALRDVGFTLEHGRSLGVIGHNGAGKSTLLRLLCGLGRPTSGRIRCDGQVSGLLELGGGFMVELSGRQNILTAGLLNGLTERQVREQQDAIIAFAELEDFIDQPVRTYSSGMYLRLAFAVAMHFDPTILVLDEVLAVGDSRFQKKCLARFAQFRDAGKTLIIASHSTDQIQALCDEVLVLEEGRVMIQGDPESALRCYEDLMRQRTRRRAAQLDVGGVPDLPEVVAGGSRQGTREASIEAVRVYGARDGASDGLRGSDGVIIDLDYQLVRPFQDLALSLGIFSQTHVKCFEINVPSTSAVFGPLADRGTIRCHFPTLPLLPERYYVNVGLYPPDYDYVYDYHWNMHPLDIVSDGGAHGKVSGVVSLSPVWSLARRG